MWAVRRYRFDMMPTVRARSELGSQATNLGLRSATIEPSFTCQASGFVRLLNGAVPSSTDLSALGARHVRNAATHGVTPADRCNKPSGTTCGAKRNRMAVSLDSGTSRRCLPLTRTTRLEKKPPANRGMLTDGMAHSSHGGSTHFDFGSRGHCICMS